MWCITKTLRHFLQIARARHSSFSHKVKALPCHNVYYYRYNCNSCVSYFYFSFDILLLLCIEVYRVIFCSPSISVPKWKPTSSQSRPFFNSNRIYCTSSRAWLLEGFLFGAEIWGDQLKKSPSIWTCFSKFHECIAAATHVLNQAEGGLSTSTLAWDCLGIGQGQFNRTAWLTPHTALVTFTVWSFYSDINVYLLSWCRQAIK